MMRRTPLKRTGWTRKPCSQARQLQREDDQDLVVVSEPPKLLRRGVYAPVADQPVVTVVKDEAVRSEPYRRLVASLPCANCGRVGRSQHAHTNAGKAKGMKNDDRDAMPLCADDYGILGCHSRFDRYALFLDREEHRRKGAEWAEQTRSRIEALGLWPASVPRWRA